MALYKIGTHYYDGGSAPVYLMQGTAVRDAEWCPIKGKDHAKVSIVAKTNEDGSTMYVNLNGWRGRAADVAAIQKLDSILAIGVLKKRNYNERDYYDMDADFLCLSGSGLNRMVSNDRPAPDYAGAPAGFTELDEDDEGDGELPF